MSQPDLDSARVAAALHAHLKGDGVARSLFAERSGVSQPTLSRLLASPPASLRQATLRKVWTALPRHRREEPERPARLTVPDAGGRSLIRVFLSSTFLDLEDRRSRVLKAIESFPEMKCVAMERFTASTRPALDDCLDAAASCDLYVGILAYRYGWIPDGEERSITELEHDAAQRAGIPRLVFTVDPRKRPMVPEIDADPGEDRWERQAQLDAFRRRLSSTGITPRPFGDDAELVHHVMQAIVEWRDAHGLERPKRKPKAPAADPDLTRYREALLAEHRDLPLVGFPTSVRVPIGLDELFVPLRARAGRISKAGDEKVEREHELETELPFARRPSEDGEPEPASGATVFSRADRDDLRIVIVLGDAGSGKTSQLRRLTNAALTSDPERLLGLDESPDESPDEDGSLLPVFLPLRELRREHVDAGLAAAITHCLPDYAKLDELFARRLVERGRLLLLLDGLDEVESKLRDRIATWVRELIEQDATSWCVLSSRPAGYTRAAEKALEGAVLPVEILPFDDEQVDHFVRRWYRIVERGHKLEGFEERAETAAADLLERLSSPALYATRVYEMTANPLLLTVMCLVHRDAGSYLPEDRERLYREASEVLLERWRAAKGLTVELSADRARTVLQPVAHYLHQVEGHTSATAEELEPVLEDALEEAGWTGTPDRFLLAIRDDSGLLCGESNDRYKFLHLGFQEYFTALHLHGLFAEWGYEERERADELLDEIAGHFGESWWQEVLLLLLAHPHKPFCFRPLMERIVRTRAFVENEDLVEACLREARGVTPRPFVEYLDQYLERPRLGRTEQRAVAAIVRLLKRRVPDELLEPKRARGIVGRAAQPGAVGREEAAELLLDLAQERAPALARELEQILAARRKPPAGAAADGELRTRRARAGIELVLVPGGEFVMGGTRHGDEKPKHRVRLEPFWMARTPVTNAQYREFVEDTGREPPKSWREKKFNAPDQPVVRVSWEDARAFCEWAELELPSEAQWEYACRGGTSTEYWFGDKPAELAEYAWYSENSGGAPKPVGQKPANPFGLYDVHGNVWEWCQDQWHDNYEGAPDDGSAWEEGGAGDRVYRGGSWHDVPGGCRAAYRSHGPPVVRHARLGFRPAVLATD